MSKFTKREEKMYLDYLNNFLTIPAFAEYYAITDKEARLIINKVRKALTN